MPYLTYFDVVEHLITSSFGGPQDAEQRDIRTAVQRAYAELTQIRDWAYYHVHGRLITSAPYSTGTVNVTNNSVVGSGTSFPTWAATGAYMKIGEEIARVRTRGGAANLALDPLLGLKANVSNQPYTLYRTVYALPSDFRNLDEPSDEYNWWAGLYVTPDEAMKIERVSNSSGAPYHWTIIKNPDGDGWAIKLLGYPTQVETIDFTYRRTARAIRWSGHESSARAGTASASGDGFVYGTGTAFQSSCVGSKFRVGTAQSHPGPDESITPYAAEATVTGVGDIETLTTSPSLTFTAGTKYLITDPIDIAPHMHNAMFSAAEYWLARIRNQKPDNAFAMYQRDLRLAMEMDQLAPLSGRSREIYHDGGWKSPLKPDAGT